MYTDESAVIGLVGALYESAAAPERWEGFLSRVAEWMPCEHLALTLHDDRLTNWNMQHSFGLPPEALKEYNAHYGAINPTIQPLFKTAREAGSWHGLARPLTGETQYKKSEYYNDFGRKYGSYWGVMGAVVLSPRAMITLSAVRPENKPAPGPEAVERMGLLMPHFRSVVKIHRAMESLRSMASAAVTAMDAVEGVFVAVDGEGGVVLTNGGAEKILRQDDGVALKRNRLSAESPHEARELDFLIQSAAATGAGRDTHPGGSMLIHRRVRRPLQISVVPFQSSCMLTGASPCALIFIGDPDGPSASRAAVLSSLYQLTPSECRLADLLLQDLELIEAAESLGVTRGTARFMLKNIFRKTGTHRQPELMRFLLGLPNVVTQ
jgi:DNA-binding CsgD family transcriptional regulator/PAS domain-containing protein